MIGALVASPFSCARGAEHPEGTAEDVFVSGTRGLGRDLELERQRPVCLQVVVRARLPGSRPRAAWVPRNRVPEACYFLISSAWSPNSRFLAECLARNSALETQSAACS